MDSSISHFIDILNDHQIAYKMPFPENFFYEWKRRGTIPSLENLIAIAQYFDVSIDYLLGRTDDKHN
jgi:bacteriophage CI repressor helix-turn-helix domain